MQDELKVAWGLLAIDPLEALEVASSMPRGAYGRTHPQH